MIDDKFTYGGDLVQSAGEYMKSCFRGEFPEAQPILVEAAMTMLSETKWVINPQVEEPIDEQNT